MNTWSRIARTACVLALCVVPVSAGQEKQTEETPAAVSVSSREGANLRPITLSDLLTIRDCEGVSISPNGKYVAFVTGQAVYETNDYRSRLFVASTQPGSVPEDLGSAGLPHWDSINQWAAEAPQWSPDSGFITYRMRTSVTEQWQVWRWNRNGGAPTQLTHAPGDVIEYHWTEDGSRLIMTVQDRRDPKEAVELSEHGVVYEGQVDPWKSFPIVSEVLARRSTPTETWIYEFSYAKEKRANQQEISSFGPWISDLDEQIFDEKKETFQGHHITDAMKSPDGRWVAYTYLVDDPARAKSFEVSLFSKPARGGKPIRLAPSAGGFYIAQYWWSKDSNNIYFSEFGPGGHAAKLMVIGKEGGVPRLLFHATTPEMFTTFSVDDSGKYAACENDNNETPPRVVVINLATGQVQLIFDLNEGFRSIEMSQATRVDGTNHYGDSWFAHVLKPIGYQAGKRYPLIVTTYRSGDYFLRGASGNENPIQVYAANGFVVLSFDVGFSRNIQPGDFETELLTWASPTASIEMAVNRLVDQGLVDPQRVGISGYSHGSEIVAYALTHSNLFHAASGASGYEPYFYYLGGEVWQNVFARWGLGGWPEGVAREKWKELAPSLRADKIHTALLNQVSDSEYVADLALYASLQKLGQPEEMVIYPDELHVINQPKHRYEIYERNLDWFRFWLKGEEDPDPNKHAQYLRWHKLGGQDQPLPHAIP